MGTLARNGLIIKDSHFFVTSLALKNDPKLPQIRVKGYTNGSKYLQ